VAQRADLVDDAATLSDAMKPNGELETQMQYPASAANR